MQLGIGSRNGNQYQDFISSSTATQNLYNDPTPQAINALESSDALDYYLRKYTGDNEELIDEIVGDVIRGNVLGDVSFLDILQDKGYLDANGDVALNNTLYLPDFTIESNYRPSDYATFFAPITINGRNVNGLFVEDLETGIVEQYDDDRMNAATGKYEFNDFSPNNLGALKIRIPGTDTYSSGNRADTREVLKYLYATGQIDSATVRAVDEGMFTRDWNAGFNLEVVTDEGGQYSYGMEDYVDPAQAYIDFLDADDSFAINPETNDYNFLDTYVIQNPSIVGDIDRLGENVNQFLNLPEFNVTAFDNFGDLNTAYQDRLDFIDDTSFDYSTKDFLRQSAFNLFKSREAFLDLDSTSQQLILDAQAEATSDFVDLGVFNITSNTLADLDTELQTRLNTITAADLSEEQEQYEINLANAIYDSKKTEIQTALVQDFVITQAQTQRDAAIQREGAASQTAANLQARIDKIESYEIPEFSVTAYMESEDPSAYMQNFVNEVTKGTTEEFGNFLSIENADQILVNVAALAQSETDLDIAEKARDDNYDKYVAETQRYNSAISQRDSAREQRDANQSQINNLRTQLYVEIDNFEVTADNIEGAQSQLDSYNQDIDDKVTNGEITSEQGELEKSLATNSFNVYKATQDIASLETSSEAEITRLNDLVVTANQESDRIQGLLDEAEQEITDLEAQEASLNERIAELEAIDATDSQEYQDLLQSKNNLQTNYNNLIINRNSIVDALNTTRNNLAKAEADLETAQAETEELQTTSSAEITRLNDLVVSANNEADRIQGLLDNAEIEVSDLEAEEIRLNNQIGDLESQALTDSENYTALLTEKNRITVLLGTARADRDAQKAAKESAREQVSSLQSQLETAQAATETLQAFSLPEFNVTATNQVELDAYLDSYQTYVDQAEADGNISAEQAINFDTIIASIRSNGSQIFTLESENATKQSEITRLEGVNTGLDNTIAEKDNEILDLTGTISVIGSGFDVTLYDSIDDLDTGLEAFIQGINDSDLDEEMKSSQIAFAESMADLRRENLFVPTYVAPDFNVIADGDLAGLNTSYEQAMFTLDSFRANDYLSEEEYNTNVAALDEAYNTRKDTLVPTYTLPEFTVSELDTEGGFTNLDAEKEGFLDDLQSFLDNDFITREEYNDFEAQIESAYDTKKRDITPVYELPDFTAFALDEAGGFTAIDTEYNTARNTLDTNARLGYISSSEYIDQLNELETSYTSARSELAPVYELPDFSAFGTLQEGDDFTEIDTAYQNELTKLEEYRDSGYISVSEYYDFLGDLETEYTSRRQGILPTYTMPDFGVTPATSLANLAEIEQAARDRFAMFSEQGYFPEGFDILTEQENLESLFDAERARLQGTYTLPEFAVTDTKGLLKQDDISNLFSEYQEGLQGDVLEGMLGLDDFFNAMNAAQETFDFEFNLRKPIQPREGGYQVIPDENNETDDSPSDSDFFDYVDAGNYPDQYGTIGGIDTSDILTGNYMAKIDPAYQLAEMLLGEAGAKDLFPTGKSRGLADEQFQEVVNQFMLGQADDAFAMQAGLAGKQQDLVEQLTRLKRQSDLDLMSEFGDSYRQQIEELYPGSAEALEAQREIARRSADQARGDLSPAEQSRLEQSSAIFGAQRGRDFDPITLANRIGEESQFRDQRDATASNQQIAAINAERGLFGDLMSTIGTDSPYAQGVGQITTPFNIGGIMDLGSVDYANQQRLQEARMAVSQLQRDYDTAVAMNEPSRARSTLVRLNEAKATAEAISAGLNTAQEAFGTVKNIFGGITNLFGGNKSINSFNYDITSDINTGYMGLSPQDAQYMRMLGL